MLPLLVLTAGSLPGRFLIFIAVLPFLVPVWHMPPGSPFANNCRRYRQCYWPFREFDYRRFRPKQLFDESHLSFSFVWSSKINPSAMRYETILFILADCSK